MKHEVLFLNSNRAYVLIDSVWYDTHRDLNPEVGQNFLTGKIEKVLTYEEYKAKYPESTYEMYPHMSDKTASKGYVRRVLNGVVKYAINPQIKTQPEKESLID